MNARKPRDLRLPRSKFVVAEAGTWTKGDRYVQLHAGGTEEPKTIRRMAKWLLKAARWMEVKKRGSTS
jgi:hypothetical protein